MTGTTATTQTEPEKKVTITLDTANNDKQFPAYQLSINVDEGGRGHGFRLMGPKYVGRSRNLRTVELSRRDADKIRAILDEVFPPEEKPSESYPPALPWAALMDDEDLAEFLDELEHAATRLGTPEEALAAVEKACGTWRLIAEAQHAHNTAPGPNAEAGESR